MRGRRLSDGCGGDCLMGAEAVRRVALRRDTVCSVCGGVIGL